MCGATDQMKDAATASASFAGVMREQATAIFGKVGGVFSDIINSLSPIAAAGPSQEGLTPAQLADAKSKAITENAQVSRAASQAANERIAAQGGGNIPLPSGAAVGTQLALSNAAAEREATAITGIEAQSRELGLKKWQFAEEGLGRAPGVFEPAISAGGAAVNAGQSATGAASEVAQADMSPYNAAFGAIGGIAGQAVGGYLSRPAAPAAPAA